MMASFFPLMSCFISKTLATRACYRNRRALAVTDPELGTRVKAKVKFRQIAVKVLLVDVLKDTDQTTFEDRKETFQRVRMHVAARPFVLGMVYRLMLLGARHHKLVDLRAIRYEAAALMQVLANCAANVFIVQVHGADVSAAF